MRRRLRAIGIATALAAVGAAAATASAAPLKVSVSYHARPCGDAPARLARLAPVTAGTIELDRPGNGAPVRLSLVNGGSNPARANLAGEGPVSAKLILQTPLVRVVDGPSGTAAQRIGLGTAVIRNGRVSFVLRRSDEDNGHVNTLIELQRGARFAARNSPRRLPVLSAHVFDGPIRSRPPTAFDAPAAMDVGTGSGGFGGTGATDAQWEPAVLLHEYGHFVLNTVAPDNSPGGDHDWSKSYPSNPYLAWSEGFASAFAALARPDWGGRLYLDCGRPAANYEEIPARPALATDTDKRYAQWSETRVAGATYQVVKHLGGAHQGFARLLEGLRAYRRDGHHVWTARDLRDMLASRFERNGPDHQRFDGAFIGQGIQWTFEVAVGVPQAGSGLEQMRSADGEIVVHVTGPGGFTCQLTGDDVDELTGTPLNGGGLVLGTRMASGGLGFLDNDDCFLVSGDGTVGGDEKPHSFGYDGVEIPFPYLAGGAHWGGKYELHARFVCAFDIRQGPPEQFNCPPLVTMDVGLRNPLLLATVPSLASPAPVALRAERRHGGRDLHGRGEVHDRGGRLQHVNADALR